VRLETSSFHPHRERGYEIFINAMKGYEVIAPMKAQDGIPLF